MEDVEADFEARLEDEKRDFEARLEDEKRRALESVESVERAKEHEIESLRDAYETHVESSRKKTADVEDDLKEEIECLLRENERTKRRCDELDEEARQTRGGMQEMDAMRSDLDELASVRDRLSEERNWLVAGPDPTPGRRRRIRGGGRRLGVGRKTEEEHGRRRHLRRLPARART